MTSKPPVRIPIISDVHLPPASARRARRDAFRLWTWASDPIRADRGSTFRTRMREHGSATPVDHSALDHRALDAFLYRDRPVRVAAPSRAEVSGALFHALSPGAEAVLIGGDEAALRAAGFEILPCPVPEAIRVRKQPALLLAWVRNDPDGAFPGAEWDADAPCGTALVGFREDGRGKGETSHIARCRVCAAKFAPAPAAKETP